MLKTLIFSATDIRIDNIITENVKELLGMLLFSVEIFLPVFVLAFLWYAFCFIRFLRADRDKQAYARQQLWASALLLYVPFFAGLLTPLAFIIGLAAVSVCLIIRSVKQKNKSFVPVIAADIAAVVSVLYALLRVAIFMGQ